MKKCLVFLWVLLLIIGTVFPAFVAENQIVNAVGIVFYNVAGQQISGTNLGIMDWSQN